MSRQNDFDVAVIGSGAGGLAAAVALAQAGRKVVVLEQHYVPGGWCHTFQRGGYRFSPGVHYVGRLRGGGALNAIYRGLGVSQDLEFCELNPDAIDHILVGKERFDIPKGRERFQERLSARFPGERAGIKAYFDAVERMTREIDSGLSKPGGLLFCPMLLRWGFFSAASFIGHYAKNPVLRAIMAGQSGNHGLPPSMAPAPVHAAIVAHYLDGGYYPRGGAYTIPRAFTRALKRAGGELRLRAPVERILLEKGRAIGVRLRGGEEIRCEHVVSNADPEMTFARLVGLENVSWRLRRRVRRTRYSVSALSLFFAADCDPRSLGLDSGNFWQYDTPDLDAIYRRAMTPWSETSEDITGMFLTCTTLKDPSKYHRGHHTFEAFTFVAPEAFRDWENSAYGGRPDAYEARKQRLTQAMLKAVAKIAPGLPERVLFAELGTPLTNKHYVASANGNLYGTEKGFSQIGPWAFGARTEIANLRLCGASTLSHGVLGATGSGLSAAADILGCGVGELLRRKGPPIRIYPSEDLSAWPAALQGRTSIRSQTLPVTYGSR